MAPTHGDAARLLTKQEACQWLSLSLTTLNRLIRAHEIDVTRVGTGKGSVRISQRALDDYARRNTVRATSGARR